MSKSFTSFAVLSISAFAFIAPAGAEECSTASAAQPTELAAQQSTQQADQQKYFIADSFGFGVEREMKESGEKGGTEDINIGVGELQECTISKSAARKKTLSR